MRVENRWREFPGSLWQRATRTRRACRARELAEISSDSGFENDGGGQGEGPVEEENPAGGSKREKERGGSLIARAIRSPDTHNTLRNVDLLLLLLLLLLLPRLYSGPRASSWLTFFALRARNRGRADLVSRAKVQQQRLLREGARDTFLSLSLIIFTTLAARLGLPSFYRRDTTAESFI